MTFEIYRDQRGEWRWRLRSKNGKKVGDSGEGHKRRGHCKKMVEKIILGPHKIEFV